MLELNFITQPNLHHCAQSSELELQFQLQPLILLSCRLYWQEVLNLKLSNTKVILRFGDTPNEYVYYSIVYEMNLVSQFNVHYRTQQEA